MKTLADKDVRDAALMLTDDPDRDLTKEALGALFEPAFTVPTRGLAYPCEIDDLLTFIGSFSANRYDDPDRRALALVFEDVLAHERASETKEADPVLRAAWRDLVRDVARYFLRVSAYNLADDLEEMKKERAAAEGRGR